MTIHKFEKHSGYDAVSRDTVNSITNANALGLWVYLITKPETWIPREKEIREHFNWGHDKYRSSMTWLKNADLAEWVIFRGDSGRITGKTLHIYAETNARQNQQQVYPTASLPDHLENKEVLEKKDHLENKEVSQKKWIPPDWINKKPWAEFEQHRREIRKPLTDQARAKNANVLKTLTPHQQQASVDNTIANHWTGLFAPKAETRTYTAPEDLNREFQKTLGKPPPIGKTADECRSILAAETKKANKPQAWWDA